MAELSLIEFIVFGLVGYLGFIFVLTVLFKNLPNQRDFSAFRVVILVPSIFCILILMNVTAIVIEQETTETMVFPEIVGNDTTGNFITEVRTIPAVVIDFETDSEGNNTQPVWPSVHFVMFLIMLVFIGLQMIFLFTRV